MSNQTFYPMKNKKVLLCSICIFLAFSFILPSASHAQSTVNRDTMIVATQEIIKGTTYCGLVTIDSTGQPHVRTMNPFPVKDDLIIWFATSRSSRKASEIKNNPKVSVYFSNHIAVNGYASISGTVVVIDDKELLTKMKRDYWETIPNWQTNFVLIKIVPKTLEVINYKHGLTNDPRTFKSPAIDFK